MSTATPFPFDPQPGAAARGTVPGGGSSARPERHGAPDGESDFARSLLEVQENDNTAGAETPVPPDSRAAGAQAVAATENGGAPHEVSAFLARLFASGHPDQPALGKTFAPGQADTGEGEPPTDAAAGLAETLEDALVQPDAAENGETPEAEVTAEAITDPAILAAALAEDQSAGEAVPPQAIEGEKATEQVEPQAATATETKAAPPVADATPLPDGEDAEATDTAGAGETDLPEMEAAAAASTASALNSAPQSEAARARNAAHLPPLPENANPRAQAMARPQFDGEAPTDDAPLADGGEKGKAAETAAANAAARRNEAAVRPAPPAPQGATPPQATAPTAGLDGQLSEIDPALSGTGSTQLLSQNAQASAATQLANQYSPTATVPLAQLAVQIASRHRAGHSRFEIRIDPPELGRVDVRLDMGQDGSVTTRMVVERAETLDLLQRDARALERALGEAGLNAQEGSLQFSLKGDGFGHNQAENGEQDTRARGDLASEISGEQPVADNRYRPAWASDRALDIRV